jgi:hypothetical protein
MIIPLKTQLASGRHSSLALARRRAMPAKSAVPVVDAGVSAILNTFLSESKAGKRGKPAERVMGRDPLRLYVCAKGAGKPLACVTQSVFFTHKSGPDYPCRYIHVSNANCRA